MLPWVYGFTWETGNVLFLTIFYVVSGVILAACGIAARRALRDLKSTRIDEIKWHVDFEDIPSFAKTCRHVFTGELSNRVCHNGFDCRTCKLHADLTKVSRPTAPLDPPHSRSTHKIGTSVFGLHMPADRLYHRGHTWVRRESDGKLTVGLDDFGERMIGRASTPEFPSVGTKLVTNGTGWFFRRGESRIRILSPVEGKVVAVGGRGNGFYLRVDTGNDSDLRHLLKGVEIQPWIMTELERLEIALSTEEAGVSLADGGELVEDMPANYPGADWDSLLGEVFLEP